MSEENKNIEEEQPAINRQQSEENVPEETTMPEATTVSIEEQPQIEQSEIPMTIGTTNLKPSTSEMEIHHQGHVHHQRKWKEYLFEFLMLFLAVSAGFFVENLREHYVEKQRAKVLVTSFITDLQKDTLLISWLEDFRIHKRKLRLDSFYMLLNTPPEKIDKKIYYSLIYNIAELWKFNQSTGTINQLKNAGYLRYFNDNKLLNYISEYEYVVQNLKGDETLEYGLHYDQFMQLVKQNADDTGLRKVYFENSSPNGIGITPIEPATLKRMKILLTELSWYNYPQMKILLEEVKNKAVEIMIYLHTEYHLD